MTRLARYFEFSTRFSTIALKNLKLRITLHLLIERPAMFLMFLNVLTPSKRRNVPL